MIRIGTALASALLLTAFASPVAASGNSGSQQTRAAAPAEKSAEARGQRRICVQDRLTGTRMIKPVCKTADEWRRDGETEIAEQ